MTQRIRKREHDPQIVKRIQTVIWVAFGLFALLMVRVYWLQVVQYERFRTLSENNRLRIRTIRAPRGQILDRKGRPIAETQASFDLICSPIDVADLEGELKLLAEIVDFDTDEIPGKIRDAKKKNPYSSITVARDLRFEQVSVIEFNREALRGFSVLVEAKRSYPYGRAFAHVLGYVGEVSQAELDASEDELLGMGDVVGKYGLEREEDDVLRGINGGRHVEVDAAGRDKRLVEEVPPRAGGIVTTTLDADIQKTAEEAMEGKAGAVIAMVPKTGDILAFVSAPTFDPSAFSRGIRKAEWQELSNDPRKPMQNKGLQGTYAPGSTVKPFVALAALEEGLQDPKATVRCPGHLWIGNRAFRCWREKGHGSVDMYKGIVQSCDVYFYTMGMRLGPDRIAKLERDAGLGTLTEIELPGERKGLVPDSEWKRKVSKERWYDSERAILGIGQGAIHVTPLEMLAGYASIATGGEVMRPRLVDRIAPREAPVEQRAPKMLRKLPWKPENVAFVRRALGGVVNDHGTGGAAKLQGIEVGGKTGTAQVAAVKGKMIKSENLPYNLRDHAWFVGFAPVSDPEICVVAMLEHGGHGGSAAAPVVKAVMQEYFRTKQPAEAAAKEKEKEKR
ncbi:MAG: penicillin-binding protein 2 [Deltaproteobacteria bacterium]|nr:penicillin-binding protein 2 [Deltaproteobacteria bacterium]